MVFLKIGFFAIGGAYSFLPLLEKELVEHYHWLNRDEFLEVLGMVKIFPGAISIKYAAYTGYKIAGIKGLIAANLGNLIAPIIIIWAVSGLYTKYKDFPAVARSFGAVQLAVFAMMIALALKLVPLGQLASYFGVAVVLASFVLFLFTRAHPAMIIAGAALAGLFFNK